MTTIKNITILAKPSAGEDFQFVWPRNVNLEPEIEKMAGQWLQAHIVGGNAKTTAIVNRCGKLWLLKGANERGTDYAGRQLAYLAFGEIEADAEPENLVRWLLAAYQENLPNKEFVSEVELPLGPETTALPSETDLATLTLATRSALTAVVKVPATAAAVARNLGLSYLNYIALFATDYPDRLPPGPGLIISEATWSPPRPVQQFTKQVTMPPDFDWRDFVSQDFEAERSLSLLNAVIQGTVPDDVSFIDKELFWLYQNPLCREQVLKQLDAHTLNDWLLAKRLTADDLDFVKESIVAEHSQQIAVLLGDAPDGFQRFVELFGAGAEGIERLLPIEARRWWEVIRTHAEPVEGAIQPDDWKALVASGLLKRLDLGDLAWLMRTPLRERFSEQWRFHLKALEFPEATEQLSAAGFGEASLALLNPEAIPPERPPNDWEALLIPLLSKQVAQREFWTRRPGGMEPALVRWLREQLGSEPGGSLVGAVAEALDGERRLSLKELHLFGEALGNGALCRQAVLWALRREAQTPEALRLLLNMPAMRPGLANWLETELLTCEPQRQDVELSPTEMITLLPLLHPVKDIIRPVMARAECSSEEGVLLPLLVEQLKRVPVIAPGAPNELAAKRRPDWVSALSLLPGWSHWQG